MSSMARTAVADPLRANGGRPVLQRKCACGNATDHEEQCESCQQKGVQRKAAGSASPVAPAIVHDVVRSGGRPLDTSTRTFFESRFGHDFSAVRIHDDTHAARSARAVNARVIAGPLESPARLFAPVFRDPPHSVCLARPWRQCFDPAQSSRDARSAFHHPST